MDLHTITLQLKTIGHLYISDFDSKFIRVKVKFNENKIHFPHNLLKILIFVNFLVAITLSSDLFYMDLIYRNYEKIIFKFIVFIIALAKPGTILPVLRDIACIKKMCRFRIK